MKKTQKNPIFGPPENRKLPPFLAGADKAKNPDFGKIPSGGKAPLRHPLKSGFLRFFRKLQKKNRKKSAEPRKPLKKRIV